MSNLPYTTGRPAGNLTPAQNRPSMQTNNDSINSILPIDHFGFNDNNGGYHQKVSFPDATSPVPTPSGTLGVLYSILDSANASQLVFKNKNGIFQLTGATSGGTIIAANIGQTFLPGGILLKWGRKTMGSSGTTLTITFTSEGLTAFPNGCFGVWATSFQSNRYYYTGSYTTTSFAVATPTAFGPTDAIFWVAIGN